MYSFIKGKIVDRTNDFIVIENNGIGYEIIMPFEVSSKLGHDYEDVIVYLYQSVKEDDISLFGFISKDIKDIFLLLITVSGIGPKVASSICASIDRQEFISMVLSEDIKRLTSIKGLGKKGAERIVLELKDKFKSSSIETSPNIESVSSLSYSKDVDDALMALINLGYKKEDAKQAIDSLYEEGMDISVLIRNSLRYLSRK